MDEDAEDRDIARQAGFDLDSQSSQHRLSQHRKLGFEESKLRAELDVMLSTPLGKKAEHRRGQGLTLVPHFPASPPETPVLWSSVTDITVLIPQKVVKLS